MGHFRCGGRKSGDGGVKNGAGGRRRANHAGTLEKRGSKWRARWISYTPQGEPVRMSKTLDATNREDARRQLDELTGTGGLMSAENDLLRVRERLEGVRAEIARIEDSKPAIALSAMFAAFLASPEKKWRKRRSDGTGDATMRQYRIQAGRFVAWVAEHHPEATEMRHISNAIAREFLSELAATRSGNTYNKYLMLLDLIWRTLGAEAKCKENPWDGMNRRGSTGGTGRRALAEDELRKVCSMVDGEMRVLFALGIYTGLRLGDCALLDWEAVDMKRRIIFTAPIKTKKHGITVEIPIHPALMSVLEEIPEEQRSGFLMPEVAKTYRRDRSALTDRIQGIFKKAGIKTNDEVEGYAREVVKVGFHSLRHTFVSAMGNAGTPLALVQSIVGHSNPMMTSRYFHAQTEALTNAMSALPDLLPAGEPRQINAEAAVEAAGREESGGRDKDADGQEDALRAFRAAYAALGEEERKKARKWLGDGGGKK